MLTIKRISFVDRSLNDLKHFPEDARREAGYQLDKVQRGFDPADWKPSQETFKGSDSGGSIMTIQFNSVWDALEEDPVKRENMKLRSQLMIEINTKLDQSGEKQADIAERLQTTQPRVSALRKGKVNDFRLDMLIDFALRLGLHVSIDVAA